MWHTGGLAGCWNWTEVQERRIPDTEQAEACMVGTHSTGVQEAGGPLTGQSAQVTWGPIKDSPKCQRKCSSPHISSHFKCQFKKTMTVYTQKN